MTSVSSRGRSANKSVSEISPSARGIAKILGLVCLVGFAVDFLVLSLPPNPGNIQWRIGLLQQVGDRGIILLFGVGLLLFSQMMNRSTRKLIAMTSLALGAVFLVGGIAAIRDSSKLGNMTTSRIDNQAIAIQQRLEQVKADASIAPDVSDEQLQQAQKQLIERSQALQKQAKTGALRQGAGSVGNLFVAGVGLVLLGRLGQRGY